MLQIKNVTLYRGKKCLLEGADLTVHAEEKVGLVGSNGVGKSSLFQLMLGRLETDKGECGLPNGIRLAQIRQEVPSGKESAVSYVLSADQALTAILSALAKAEDDNDGMLISECHLKLAEIDGYSAQSRAAKILVGLGFSHDDLARPVDDFSGGWRMRLNLAQVLMVPSDFLLLDEPTNHLDLEAIFWLENCLREMKKTILIISHDREFLDHVVQRIVLVKDLALHSFSGSYSVFEEQYAAQLEQQQAAYLKQQRQISHMMKFVDKFRYRATKAKQAQSRLKMIDRIDKVSAIHLTNPFSFQFKPAASAGNPMISFRDVNIGYGEAPILKKVSLSICPGDRIALLGKNGAGKSTLIKALASVNQVDGETVYNAKMTIGYFTQHQIEALTLENNACWHLQALAPQLSESEIRKFLGGFNFSGDRIFEPVSHFSGGEKARLALSLLVWQAPNLLLLDEPSNHFDLEMRQALTMALQNYEGALILVAHDQYLLENIPDQFFLVANNTVKIFSGNLESYHKMVSDEKSPPEKTKKIAVKKVIKKSNNWQTQYIKLEEKLAAVQKQLVEIETSLADTSLYQEGDKSKQLTLILEDQKACQAKIMEIEEAMLAALEKDQD